MREKGFAQIVLIGSVLIAVLIILFLIYRFLLFPFIFYHNFQPQSQLEPVSVLLPNASPEDVSNVIPIEQLLRSEGLNTYRDKTVTVQGILDAKSDCLSGETCHNYIVLGAVLPDHGVYLVSFIPSQRELVNSLKKGEKYLVTGILQDDTRGTRIDASSIKKLVD